MSAFDEKRKRDYPYRAYLLRCWREGRTTFGGRPRWRFSLEGVLHERPRRGFETLEALVAFLRGELADGDLPPPQSPPKGEGGCPP